MEQFWRFRKWDARILRIRFESTDAHAHKGVFILILGHIKLGHIATEKPGNIGTQKIGGSDTKMASTATDKQI